MAAFDHLTGGYVPPPTPKEKEIMGAHPWPVLKPYPFPEGMEIPRLMPFQEYPWNGDHFLAAEVLRLKGAHGLTCALETGTCLGSTAMWLAENFTWVATFELHETYFNIACERIEDHPDGVDIHIEHIASVDGLRHYHRSMASAELPLYWLDAHWTDNCPLLDELTVIAERGPHCCILIHDFQVPGTDFGFDSMPDGRPFNLELIAGHLDRIYGEGKYKTNYPTEVAGAKRGWISIEPC